MPAYRNNLPQLDAPVFLTDGGLETSLIFDDGHRAARLRRVRPARRRRRSGGARRATSTTTSRSPRATGRHRAGDADLAGQPRLGARASATTLDDLAGVNRAAVDLLLDVRRQYATPTSPVVISGCIGPRGDGYQPDSLDDRRRGPGATTRLQVDTFAASEADLVTAITMTYPDEAIGIVARPRRRRRCRWSSRSRWRPTAACRRARPSATAIEAVDAATDSYPAYYMVNCAHPTHFDAVLEPARRGRSGSAASGPTRRR